jgi:hypothetical protein
MVPLPPLPSRLFAPIPLCTDWRALCPDLGRWFASRLRGWPPVDGAGQLLVMPPPLLLLLLLLLTTLLLLTLLTLLLTLPLLLLTLPMLLLTSGAGCL